VTVPTDRHLTYARLLRALCIRLSFSPFFLYISIVQLILALHLSILRMY
jgi:hypothetical protein